MRFPETLPNGRPNTDRQLALVCLQLAVEEAERQRAAEEEIIKDQAALQLHMQQQQQLQQQYLHQQPVLPLPAQMISIKMEPFPAVEQRPISPLPSPFSTMCPSAAAPTSAAAVPPAAVVAMPNVLPLRGPPSTAGGVAKPHQGTAWGLPRSAAGVLTRPPPGDPTRSSPGAAGGLTRPPRCSCSDLLSTSNKASHKSVVGGPCVVSWSYVFGWHCGVYARFQSLHKMGGLG